MRLIPLHIPTLKRSKPALAILISLFLLLRISSCKQSQNDISPPPDKTLHPDIIQSFIQKVWLNLTGREANEKELHEAFLDLKNSGFTEKSRKKFITHLQSLPEFHEYLYKENREYLLNFIFQPSFIPQTLEIWEKLPENPERNEEIERLKKLQSIPEDLNSGLLNIQGLQRRLCHNSFYDFVNMGTENFVVSCFENFLLRFPTLAEKEAGKIMVDGKLSVLFFRKGQSKSDFLDILFSHPEYDEGQVRLLYRKYLFREPETEELSRILLALRKDSDLKKI